MDTNEIKDWIEFFGSVFGYSFNLAELHIGVKPIHECVPIVVPKDEMAVALWKELNPNQKDYCAPPETQLVQIYRRALDFFPYTRWTPKPHDCWSTSYFFCQVEDACLRPPKPYVVWIKIPDFAEEGRYFRKTGKLHWEEKWNTPGPTLLEQMLLDLFWWNKFKTPFGINRNDWGDSHNYCLWSSTLCNGSRFKAECDLEKRYNDNTLRKYFGHKPTYLIPDTMWGAGGWSVSYVGFKSATTPSPIPCLVSF